jgi:hypothetical protein
MTLTPEQRALIEYTRQLAREALAELEAAGVIEPVPSLLESDWRRVRWLAAQGWAYGWLLDQLDPVWAAHPEMRLSDRLKTERPERLAELAAGLRQVGLMDLDELLTFDPEVPDD